jgi:hypothetical protein
MENLKSFDEQKSKSVFDKKVLSVIQHLHPYVKHRLYIAESTGILPRNMYSSTGIIDDSIVKLYSKGFDKDADATTIKLELFKIVDHDLEALFKKEAFHKKTLSTDTILKDELESLNEEYTVDEDFDFIMNDELNDISYKQQNGQNHIFLYDSDDSTIFNAFEVPEIPSKNKEKFLGSIYSRLPMKVSDIIDLYVFGKLNYEEISQVKHMEISRIEKIFEAFNKRFKRKSS